MIEIIAFDADDTLWHNERYYTEAKDVFIKILKRYHDEEWIGERLDKTEMQNLNRYGYGIKSFTLSMIETAIQLTEGRINGNEIQEIISIAWEMLRQPIEVFPGVRETIETLKNNHKILLITKGDLFEQEAKIARSGLGDLFDGIEIVSEKNPAAYQEIVNRYQVKAENFLMIGNSLKSDVLPVVAIGGVGVHIPFETTWVHELVDEKDLLGKEYSQLNHISEIIEFLKKSNTYFNLG
jgi:putative hydrolase of the HAD superfamily